MRNLFSTKVKIILVVAALLTAALAIYSGISNQSLPSVIVQGVLAPFRAAGTTLTNTAEKYYSYMFRYEALDAENKVLEERIAQMEDVARQADSVSRENERLRKLLELKATNEDYKLVDAYIIGWSSSDWESTFTINRGTNAGIRENLCAITANGEVVGLVTEVGVNYAVVKTVLDSTLEISGTISTSGYNGMVKGGYTSGNDTLLQMNYLPSDSIIRNKDQVVTSGSTVYPRGLIIGSVVDAGYEETGVAKFALLDPAADINSLEQVFIITQYTTEVVTTPGTSTGSETATAPSETAATTQPTTPVGWGRAMARRKLSKQSEFKPDPRQNSLSGLFHVTQLQKQRMLKWTLYVLTGILLLTIQDVIMSRVSIFGATTDLPVVYILLITVIEGVDVGSLFVLFASTIYYFSGSAPGPYCIGLLCAVGIIATLLRQAYLRRTKASIVICAGIALTIYEMGLFVVGIGLGLTRWDRVFSFLITAGYSFGVMILLYPLINKIGLIGGTTWKE